MLLLTDGVDFVEPADDLAIQISFRIDAQVVRMTARIDCFDFVESFVVDLAWQNEMTDQMRFSRRRAGETHPRLKDNARFLRDHARAPAARHHFGELAERLRDLWLGAGK